MEEMEVRTEDLEVVETNDKEANGSSGIGVGLAMLIGSGLTLAAIAGGKNKALSLFYFIRRCLNGRLYSEFSQV